MPSFAAHLIIAQEIIAALNDPAIKENKNYFLLGSLGPDLPYYRNVFGTAIGTFFEEKYNPESPGFYLGYGDYFHSKKPNLFPMKMLEIIKKDKDPSTENSKLSFTFGYLTHVAADQHIHPFVERFAGPFYISGTNRKKHRTLEVYQDLLLHKSKFPHISFFDEDFRSWIDVSPPKKELPKLIDNPEYVQQQEIVRKEYIFPWFKSFISRSFFESYGCLIEGEEVEKWIGGFNSILGVLKSIGPYYDAGQNILKDSEEAKGFQRLFEEENYLSLCFERAKKISIKYIQAANQFYESKQISEKERREFLEQVPDEDLTSPLMEI